MKGWVYVISNQAMPGLIKIGYSTKDPELRARELNHTGSPHPYIVEYEMLIDEPYRLEQQVHKALRHQGEGREWFRCSAEEAIAVIKQVAEGRAIHEVFKRAEREKAEQIRKEREEAEFRQKRIDALIARQIEIIQSEYRDRFRTTESFKKYPFWMYWIVCTIGVGIGVTIIAPKISESSIFWLSIISGAIAAYFLDSYIESRVRHSAEYKALVQERESTLEQARKAIVVSCPNCQKALRFDVQRLLSSENGTWKCPGCKTVVEPLKS